MACRRRLAPGHRAGGTGAVWHAPLARHRRGRLPRQLLAGAPVLVACGMALGNTLEALIATVLLTRVVGFHPSLDRLRDVLGVIVLAAGLSTLVSATG